ncbi:hypothetical protein M2281_002391 [Mesorhizobium soli]|uniref:DUF982 domain-containing protein n=1 Tax=Pseudaminobacter soli (ex Li et al. 2025) TaxID=1295366 RepID=UPI002474360E|nr:DUF982 domain-containing protein [Mesorhizobium soli]MDH6231793.1 hypothetical protein [Mesorhizobium soli]
MDRGEFFPVAVTLSDGTEFCVADVLQAGDFLLHQWPRGDSLSQSKARRACLKFIEGRATVEEVRRAFEQAAEDAGILVHRMAAPG